MRLSASAGVVMKGMVGPRLDGGKDDGAGMVLMNRPLAMTKRQARVLLQAANAEGGRVDFNPKTGVISLIPAVLVNDWKPPAEPVDEEPKGYL